MLYTGLSEPEQLVVLYKALKSRPGKNSVQLSIQKCLISQQHRKVKQHILSMENKY